MTRPNKPLPSAFIPYYDGDLYPHDLHEVYEYPVQTNVTAMFEHPIMDHWIHAELNLCQEEDMKKVKLVCQSKDNDINIIGKYDSNAMLYTMVYDVEFLDVTIREYGAKVIADNMYSQVYSEGFLHYILYGIFDFAKDNNAAHKGDQYIITKSIQHFM